MFTYTKKSLPKSTFELTVTIPWTDIQEEYAKAFAVLHQDFAMEGFRKGKVPKPLAEQQIPKDQVYQQLIRSYLPSVYEDIVKKENLKPIISPKVDLVKAKENEDWQLKITAAERPTADLSKYKEVVKKAKSEANTPEIWVPGKEPAKDEKKEENNQKVLNTILSALLKEVSCDIPDLVVEEELNNRLTRLVDDIQKIGLTTDTYLKSRNLTMDQLKKQYTKEIEDMYKMEFILLDIAEKEQITVEQNEIDDLFKNIKDENEKKVAQQNAYYYASVLRKQKTLDRLISL